MAQAKNTWKMDIRSGTLSATGYTAAGGDGTTSSGGDGSVTSSSGGDDSVTSSSGGDGSDTMAPSDDDTSTPTTGDNSGVSFEPGMWEAKMTVIPELQWHL